jgi:hypothetical protein
MSAIEPLETPAPPTPRRHLRPVTSRSAPQRRKAATTKAPEPAPQPQPQPQPPDLPTLSTQLQVLERELRQTWSTMLELDAATAGRLGHAGRLVHQASVVLGDHTAIY